MRHIVYIGGTRNEEAAEQGDATQACELGSSWPRKEKEEERVPWG